jgi:hypothetical protein
MLVAELSPNPAKSSQQVVASGASTVGGYAFVESTGKATARFVLRDGTSGSSKLLLPITLKASESTRDVFAYSSEGSKAIPLVNGAIYLEMIEGEIEGMVMWQ